MAVQKTPEKTPRPEILILGHSEKNHLKNGKSASSMKKDALLLRPDKKGRVVVKR